MNRFRGFLPASLIGWLAGTRVALLTAGVAAPAFITQTGQGFPGAIGPAIVAMWTRYDGNHYIRIAQQGYINDVDPAFFPLYPLLMQVLSLGSDDPAVLAVVGIIISNVALFGALAYLLALARLDFDESIGRRASVFYLVFPTTLFLSAVYTESLFLATAIGSFYHARRGEFAHAGAFGFLTGLTRSYGALMALPIAIEALQRRRIPWAAVGPPAAVGVYFGWLHIVRGDLLAWFRAEAKWERDLTLPGSGLLDYLEPGRWGLFASTRGVIDLLAIVGLAATALVAARRLPISYAALAGSMTLLFAMSGSFQSISRWALTVFPAFLVAASLIRNRWIYYAIVAGSLALALYGMARFSRVLWAG